MNEFIESYDIGYGKMIVLNSSSRKNDEHNDFLWSDGCTNDICYFCCRFSY